MSNQREAILRLYSIYFSLCSEQCFKEMSEVYCLITQASIKKDSPTRL